MVSYSSLRCSTMLLKELIQQYRDLKGGPIHPKVMLRQTRVTLEFLTIFAVLAQLGKLRRSNIATPYELTQANSTVTAIMFIPNPAFA